MSHYRPYPSYKPSGFAAVRDVPTHWEVGRVARLGTLYKANGGSKEDNVETGVPCVRYGDLYTTHDHWIKESPTFVAQESVAEYTPIRLGDVLFAASGETLEEIGKSAVNLMQGPACCGGDVIVLRPTIDADPLFLGYALDCSAARAQKGEMGRGFTVKHIYGDQLRNLRLPIPPASEQRRIGVVLERETARIDALIAKKTEFIDLLAKKRQAVITHAVTKGLDPKAKMRDSGVEWIGEVPAHWNIFSAKRLFAERDERSETGQEELMTVSHITGVTPRSEKNVNMFEAETTEGYKRCHDGDLVINTLWAWMGAMGVSRASGIVSPSYNVYTTTGRLEPEFVDLIVRLPLFATEVKRFSKGIWSSRLRLYPEAFFEIQFAAPPLEEQREIVASTGTAISRIHRLVEKTQHSIDLLKQRRSALITAAVTGQIDLRETA